jgi:predicted nucleotidyltransferase
MDEQRIIAYLRSELPALLGIYLFGSQASGHADGGSDVDLAVLVEGKADPLRLWELGQSLASQLNTDVDLVDLRAASTVMQYQIVTTGRRIWERDAQPALYESFILSEKTALDTARAGLLDDIREEGSVYGRNKAS